MKELEGWRCSQCDAIVLAYRKRKPDACPHCKELGQKVADLAQLLEPPWVILKLDRSDFPRRPKEDPNQQPLPFPEPTPIGGLF